MDRGVIKLDDHRTYGFFITGCIIFYHNINQSIGLTLQVQGNLATGYIIQQNKYAVKSNYVIFFIGITFNNK